MFIICIGICIKMYNYSKFCNCKYYFILCVSKGASVIEIVLLKLIIVFVENLLLI